MKRVLSLLLVCVMLIGGIFAMNSYAEQPEGQEFVRLLNQRRAAQGLSTLSADSELMDAAAIRAREQSVLVSHQRPDGSRFLTVSPKAEAECYWWFYPPENGTAQAALNAFMNSQDHRALLTVKELRSIGAAFYDADGKRYWVVLLSTQAADGSGGGTVSGFRDVSAGDYYAESVRWAVDNQIAYGTSSTTFSPHQTCTRAQVVTFLWRAAGSPFTFGSARFTDVPSNSYYARAVVWAVNNGITTGTGPNTFSPGLACTRAQFVTFLYRWKT